MSPIYVWAPTARCGTTLLQRLITSGKRTLCFGEYKMLTTWVPIAIVETGSAREELDNATKRLAEGEQFWCVNAVPDVGMTVDCLKDFLLSMHDVCNKTAQGYGYEGYGVKAPFSLCGASAALIKGVIPESKHLFLIRRIEPIVRSYLGRRWEVTPRLVNEWIAGLDQIDKLPKDDALMVMSYEVLMKDTDAQLDRLDAFIGAQVDRSLMGKKINIFEQLNPSGLVTNPKLSAKERKDLSKIARKGLEMCKSIESKCADMPAKQTWGTYGIGELTHNGDKENSTCESCAREIMDAETVSRSNIAK